MASALVLGLTCFAPNLEAQLAIFMWEPVQRADYFLLTITENGKKRRALTRSNHIYLPATSELSITVIDKQGRTIGWPMALVTPVPEGHMANDALQNVDGSATPTSLPPTMPIAEDLPQATTPETPASTDDVIADEGGASEEASKDAGAEPPDDDTTTAAADEALAESPAAWESPYAWSFSSALGLGSERIAAQGGASTFQAATRIAAGQFDVLAARQQTDLSPGALLGLHARLHLHTFLILQPANQGLSSEPVSPDINIDRTFIRGQLQHLVWGDYQSSLYASYGLTYLAVPFMKVTNQDNGDSAPEHQTTLGLALAVGLRLVDFAGFDGIAEVGMVPWTGGSLQVNKWTLDLEGRYYLLDNYYGTLRYFRSGETTQGSLSCAPGAIFCESKVLTSSDANMFALGLGLSF